MNKEVIEQFLESLRTAKQGQFWMMCGNCGAKTDISKTNYDTREEDVDYSRTGVYSDYTGHLWDEVVIKCKKCGNAATLTD